MCLCVCVWWWWWGGGGGWILLRSDVTASLCRCGNAFAHAEVCCCALVRLSPLRPHPAAVKRRSHPRGAGTACSCRANQLSCPWWRGHNRFPRRGGGGGPCGFVAPGSQLGRGTARQPGRDGGKCDRGNHAGGCGGPPSGLSLRTSRAHCGECLLSTIPLVSPAGTRFGVAALTVLLCTFLCACVCVPARLHHRSWWNQVCTWARGWARLWTT